jgi:hypothetical protein
VKSFCSTFFRVRTPTPEPIKDEAEDSEQLPKENSDPDSNKGKINITSFVTKDEICKSAILGLRI